MQAYIYQAALLCDDCARVKRRELESSGQAPADPDDEHTYDSDDYPKGPYSDGGGEADTPQHCDSCNVFLENPLTSDGCAYVVEAVAEVIRGAISHDVVAWHEWRPFYGVCVTVAIDDTEEQI